MTFLYRHFDEKGALLYVGISLSVTYRLSQHRQASSWFNEIARVEIERFETRDEALEAERRAITGEKPKHNRMRPAVTPIKVEPLAQSETSRADLVKRIVQFNPTYDLQEAGIALGVGPTIIKKWIAEKKLGYIVVGHTYRGNEKKRITGWQLIDFIEYLEGGHR